MDGYSENALLNTGKEILRAEARGRVTIYDGLEHRLIDHALDTQFERIDRMMFIRTRESSPSGLMTIDDDDYD